MTQLLKLFLILTVMTAWHSNASLTATKQSTTVFEPVLVEYRDHYDDYFVTKNKAEYIFYNSNAATLIRFNDNGPLKQTIALDHSVFRFGKSFYYDKSSHTFWSYADSGTLTLSRYAILENTIDPTPTVHDYSEQFSSIRKVIAVQNNEIFFIEQKQPGYFEFVGFNFITNQTRRIELSGFSDEFYTSPSATYFITGKTLINAQENEFQANNITMPTANSFGFISDNEVLVPSRNTPYLPNSNLSAFVYRIDGLELSAEYKIDNFLLPEKSVIKYFDEVTSVVIGNSLKDNTVHLLRKNSAGQWQAFSDRSSENQKWLMKTHKGTFRTMTDRYKIGSDSDLIVESQVTDLDVKKYIATLFDKQKEKTTDPHVIIDNGAQYYLAKFTVDTQTQSLTRVKLATLPIASGKRLVAFSMHNNTIYLLQNNGLQLVNLQGDVLKYIPFSGAPLLDGYLSDYDLEIEFDSQGNTLVFNNLFSCNVNTEACFTYEQDKYYTIRNLVYYRDGLYFISNGKLNKRIAGHPDIEVVDIEGESNELTSIHKFNDQIYVYSHSNITLYKLELNDTGRFKQTKIPSANRVFEYFEFSKSSPIATSSDYDIHCSDSMRSCIDIKQNPTVSFDINKLHTGIRSHTGIIKYGNSNYFAERTSPKYSDSHAYVLYQKVSDLEYPKGIKSLDLNFDPVPESGIFTFDFSAYIETFDHAELNDDFATWGCKNIKTSLTPEGLMTLNLRHCTEQRKSFQVHSGAVFYQGIAINFPDFILNIEKINRAPRPTNDPINLRFDVRQDWQINLNDYFVDYEGDTIIYSLEDESENAQINLSGNTLSGLFDQTGEYNVRLIVSDAFAPEDTNTFQVKIRIDERYNDSSKSFEDKGAAFMNPFELSSLFILAFAIFVRLIRNKST